MNKDKIATKVSLNCDDGIKISNLKSAQSFALYIISPDDEWHLTLFPNDEKAIMPYIKNYVFTVPYNKLSTFQAVAEGGLEKNKYPFKKTGSYKIIASSNDSVDFVDLDIIEQCNIDYKL